MEGKDIGVDSSSRSLGAEPTGDTIESYNRMAWARPNAGANPHNVRSLGKCSPSLYRHDIKLHASKAHARARPALHDMQKARHRMHPRRARSAYTLGKSDNEAEIRNTGSPGERRNKAWRRSPTTLAH